MKKLGFLLIISQLIYFICLSQEINPPFPLTGTDLTMGYKQTGIFDTVKAILVIDSKSSPFGLKRIEGWSIREFEKWWGGVDPYIDQSYKPQNDEWVETGRFLYHDRKTPVKAIIWKSSCLCDPMKSLVKTDKPKKKEENKDETVISYKGSFDTCLLSNGNNVIIKGDTSMLLTFCYGTSYSFTPSFSIKFDTVKSNIYIGDLRKKNIKSKKIEGYAILPTNNYLDKKKHPLKLKNKYGVLFCVKNNWE